MFIRIQNEGGTMAKMPSSNSLTGDVTLEQIPHIQILDDCSVVDVKLCVDADVDRLNHEDKEQSVKFVVCSQQKDQRPPILLMEFFLTGGQNGLTVRSISEPSKAYFNIETFPSTVSKILGCVRDISGFELFQLQGSFSSGFFNLISESSRESFGYVTATSTRKQKLLSKVGLAFCRYKFQVKLNDGRTIGSIHAKTSNVAKGGNYFRLRYAPDVDPTLKPIALAVAFIFTMRIAYPMILDIPYLL